MFQEDHFLIFPQTSNSVVIKIFSLSIKTVANLISWYEINSKQTKKKTFSDYRKDVMKSRIKYISSRLSPPALMHLRLWDFKKLNMFIQFKQYIPLMEISGRVRLNPKVTWEKKHGFPGILIKTIKTA